MYQVVAYHVASTINIKTCRQELQHELQLLFHDSDELFYKTSEDKFVYIFHYGIVSFFNLQTDEIDNVLEKIKPFCKNYDSKVLSEDMKVEIQPNALSAEFEKAVLPRLDKEMIRLVMLNTSQSVALDKFSEITEGLLVETNSHTLFLEQKGKLDISGTKLKRFIAKVLNIKNKISEHLYIFDSPDSTWGNEELDTLNTQLKKSFDLHDRYQLIHDRIEIIKENLDLFKDIMYHSESSKLEWIIIILILVEVLDLFIAKIFL